MKVIINGVSSETTRVESGVPQGTALGQLLFLCHINDLPESVTSNVRLFADNCLLYKEITTFNDHLELQEDLTKPRNMGRFLVHAVQRIKMLYP